MTKTCLKCQVEKPLGEFNKDKTRKDGLDNKCRICRSFTWRRYYKNNKPKRAAECREYRKNLPAAVYKIRNQQTGVIYIGCSTQLKRRWRRHKNYLKNNKHDNKLLQKEYNEHGLDAFEFEIIKDYPADTPFKVLEEEERKLIWESVQKGEKLYNSSIKNPLTI